MIKIPIIWNITNKCPYACSFCCLDANNTSKDLNLEGKLKIINNLDSDAIKIDFSGGEPLISNENLEVLKVLSKKFGKNRISITSTGKGLEKIDLGLLSELVSEVGFTYDYPCEPSPDRPFGYNKHNLELATEVSTRGITTIAQTPLIKSNISLPLIEQIYSNLNKSEIDYLLLMKFSSSGRGGLRQELVLTKNEIKKSIKLYRKLESIYRKPKIKLTPSLRGDFIGNVATSLNITNEGLLLSNPWSYDKKGKPLQKYILGDLTESKLSEIAGEKVYEIFFTQLRRNL